MARCIIRHKAKMLNMIFEPIANGLGGKKSKSSRKTTTQRKLRQSGKTAEQRDQMLIDRLSGMGINVK